MSASVQTGLRGALQQIAARHGAELHLAEGSVLHVQARLPSERVAAFISEVNGAACGRIEWSVRD